MAVKPLPTAQILTMLEDAPRRIAAAAVDLTPEQLRTAPEDGSWAVNEVLAHLRACADMWGGAIGTILAEDYPTIRAVNPRTWIKQTDYPDRQFHPSFQVYRAQRSDLVVTLHDLSDDDWYRAALVTGAGKPIERTLRGFAERIAVHERAHLKQIERAASAVLG